jgi:RES domain-containing protein
MELYRIARKRYIRDLSGEGARLFGGRWNSKGVPLVYTSEHVSLAAMEVLVHTPISEIPEDLMLATIQVPDHLSIRSILKTELPEGWRSYPAVDELVTTGTRWAEKRETLMLRVPSAVIPHDRNILINPLHKESTQVKISAVEEFSFDGRLHQKS